MSIPVSGTFRRSGGVVSAIGKQLRGVNLKAAKRITVKFDPFGDNVTHTRYVVYCVSYNTQWHYYLYLFGLYVAFTYGYFIVNSTQKNIYYFSRHLINIWL